MPLHLTTSLRLSLFILALITAACSAQGIPALSDDDDLSDVSLDTTPDISSRRPDPPDVAPTPADATADVLDTSPDLQPPPPDIIADILPDAPADVGGDVPPIPPTDPNAGWIGSACTTAQDCSLIDTPQCLTANEGYPNGQCTEACERFCPDLNEPFARTFCRTHPAHMTGHCVARCDHNLYRESGCREDYRCRIVPRHMESSTHRDVCIPDNDPVFQNLEACLQDLDARGITWGFWDYTTRSPDNTSALCDVATPIWVSGVAINGIRYRYYSADNPNNMAMSCELAQALHRLGDVLKMHNIVEVLHIGTFNCRTISGSPNLSEHAFGRAIDIYGFIDDQGERYILEDHWEHDTSTPVSFKAQVLYDIAQRMHHDQIFNIVLTPNFNAGHDNHFHVDVQPGANFLKHTHGQEIFYIGPNWGH